jgi:transcriptional regulator with XRE-family HTH domain
MKQIGNFIKDTRKKQGLTQDQLGERIGVKKAQVSRMENGSHLTLPTIEKTFKALGADTAHLDLGALGEIKLW